MTKQCKRDTYKWWTEEELKVLETYTADKSIQVLLPGRSWSQIKAKACRIGKGDVKNKIRVSKEVHTNHKRNKVLSYNDNVFSELTETNAYWAGFIAADGCLTTNRGRPLFSFSLKDTDAHAVEALSRHIEYSGTLLNGVKHMSSGPKYTKRLFVYGCDGIFRDLTNIYNITPRKSLTLLPPNITNNLFITAYIVGYIDGDGCISKNDRGYTINILGTNEMLSWIKGWIDTNVSGKTNQRIVKVNNYYSYTVGGKRVYDIRDTLSTYAGFRLARKWDRLLV